MDDLSETIETYVGEFRQWASTVLSPEPGYDRSHSDDLGYDEGEAMYSPAVEQMAEEELDTLIQERLQWTLEYAQEESEYWETRFAEAGITPSEVEGPEDLLALDPVDKEEFLSRQPPESNTYEWHVDPEGHSANAHCTSGSTGVEKWVFVNEDDAVISNEAVRRGYKASGIDDSSKLANFLPKGIYMSGKQSEDAANDYVDMHQAFGHTNTPPRDRVLSQFEDTDIAPDSIIASPSSLEAIARELDEYGTSPEAIGIDNIMVVGEASSEKRREAIGEMFDATVTNNYANTELGFTAYESVDCDMDGMHVMEDLRLLMLVDEEEQRLVEPGEEGEVWVTSLYPEGFEGATPVINYKVGDRAVNQGRDVCGCGRTHRVISDVRRSDNAVEANQAKITPKHVEDVIHDDLYRDILTGEYEVVVGVEGGGADTMEIRADTVSIEDIPDQTEYEELIKNGDWDREAIADRVLDDFLDSHVATKVFAEGDFMDIGVEIVEEEELAIYDEPGKPNRFKVN